MELSRGLGDVYKRQPQGFAAMLERIIEQNELPPLPFLRK